MSQENSLPAPAPAWEEAIGKLKSLLARASQDAEVSAILKVRDEVLSRFQPLFSPDGIANLTAEQFREFLMFRNNRHWKGLERLGPGVTADMDALREALLELSDEELDIAHRLDRLLPGDKARVHKLGKAILTPILLILHPDRYGVWNGITEAALKELEIWPDFDRNTSVGEKYRQLSLLFREAAERLGTDLWTLDALWWLQQKQTQTEEIDEPSVDDDEVPVQFGLERHLHDFLLDNWENTDLGREWDLVAEGGDIKGYGYERPTEIGRIDLLARHKSDPRWLVVELKRGQSSDTTVGQLARYMGWVKENLASDPERVEGLVIAFQPDSKLKYALKVFPDVRFLRYEVEFRLVEGGL